MLLAIVALAMLEPRVGWTAITPLFAFFLVLPGDMVLTCRGAYLILLGIPNEGSMPLSDASSGTEWTPLRCRAVEAADSGRARRSIAIHHRAQLAV